MQLVALNVLYVLYISVASTENWKKPSYTCYRLIGRTAVRFADRSIEKFESITTVSCNLSIDKIESCRALAVE